MIASRAIADAGKVRLVGCLTFPQAALSAILTLLLAAQTGCTSSLQDESNDLFLPGERKIFLSEIKERHRSVLINNKPMLFEMILDPIQERAREKDKPILIIDNQMLLDECFSLSLST